MKIWLISLFLLVASSAYSQTIEQATVGELNILTTYIMEDFGSDETLLDALDDNTMVVTSFKYNGELLKMIRVYSGDTAHGPIYNPESRIIIGELSDGSVLIHGKWIDINELNFDI